MLSTFLKLEICFLLTSLFIQNVFCKELNVVGKVFDKETQKPIAGVRVQIFNTNRGTYTSPSGFFKLPDIQVGSTIVLKSIGYQTKTLVVNKTSDTIFVYLEPNPIKLQEVEKVGEIEAEEIIRRAIQRKRESLAKLKTLQGKLYSKLFLELGGEPFETRFDTTKTSRTITFTTRTSKPQDSLMLEFVKNFILETFSNIYIDYEKKINYSEITQRRQTANIPKEFNQIILTNFLNFYNETVKIVNTEFVAPLADDAFKYYRFELLGKELYGDLYVYNIKIIPITKIFPAFSGTMKILEKNYNLLEIDVTPSEKTTIQFLDSIRYIQKFTTLNETYWHPTFLEFVGKINLGIAKGILDFNMHLRGVSIISDAVVNQSLPDSIISKAKQNPIVVDPKADSTNFEFWDNNSLVETTEKEKEIYKKVENISKKIDTTQLDLFAPDKKFKWGFSPDLDAIAGYNRVTGYSLSLSPYLEYQRFKVLLSPIYSFAQKKFYHDLNISYIFKNTFGTSNSSFIVSIFSKPSITSLEQNMALWLSNILSYFFHWDYYDLYQKQGFKVEYTAKNTQIKPYTKFSINFEHSKQTSLLKKTDKSLFSNKIWRENPPIAEGTYNVVGLNLDISSKPEIFGFEISNEFFSYRISVDLLYGARANGSPFGGMISKIDFQIPTFYTGYNPMSLRLLLEIGVETKETPPQYSFRLPTAWGFGNFQSARTGLFGGTKYYAIHLQHNFSDLLWRAIGLPTYKGRGLELSVLASLCNYYNYGEIQIYQPTKKIFYEIGFGVSRIPTFISDFLYLGAVFKFSPKQPISKGFGFGLGLSLPF